MQPLSGRYCRNYLRARREYSEPNRVAVAAWELPPRARRILPGGHISLWGTGTTSACAENTPSNRCWWGGTRNYLHIRGEYGFYRFHPIGIVELPPRARRILTYSFNYFGSVGTTSACAENTEQATGTVQNRGNYLRVRGEYRSRA